MNALIVTRSVTVGSSAISVYIFHKKYTLLSCHSAAMNMEEKRDSPFILSTMRVIDWEGKRARCSCIQSPQAL